LRISSSVAESTIWVILAPANMRDWVDEWVGAVGLNVREYGTHSIRRTKASLIYKATGNLRAIQILLGHSNIENTVRYLGVDIDDAITLAKRTEI
jgi:integrase